LPNFKNWGPSSSFLPEWWSIISFSSVNWQATWAGWQSSTGAQPTLIWPGWFRSGGVDTVTCQLSFRQGWRNGSSSRVPA
jgi:hypothetical protein